MVNGEPELQVRRYILITTCFLEQSSKRKTEYNL